jgi:hypothetical protein
VDLIALLNKEECGFVIIPAGRIGHLAFRIDWPFPGQYLIGVDGVNLPTCRTEFDHYIETCRKT